MLPSTGWQRNDRTLSPKLYLAFELSQTEWELGSTIGFWRDPRL